MPRKPSPAKAIEQALAAVPQQPFVTRADLIAFGSALVDLLSPRSSRSTGKSFEYATLTSLCVDYKTGRKQLAELLSTHLVRKLALPTGGIRYHREDAHQYLTAHFSVHNSSPDFS